MSEKIIFEKVREIIKTAIDRTMLEGYSGDEMADEARDEITILMIKFAEGCMPSDKCLETFTQEWKDGWKLHESQTLENIRKGNV